MRVEPNKKMVYLHISAYKNIIAELRDEIDKLKSQLKSSLTHDINVIDANKIVITNDIIESQIEEEKSPQKSPEEQYKG